MTVEQFKKENPHLSHLRGLELEEAMTNYIIRTGGVICVATMEELIRVAERDFETQPEKPFSERFPNMAMFIPTGPHGCTVYDGRKVDPLSLDEMWNYPEPSPEKKKLINELRRKPYTDDGLNGND